jgi:hypothetical protein
MTLILELNILEGYTLEFMYIFIYILIYIYLVPNYNRLFVSKNSE